MIASSTKNIKMNVVAGKDTFIPNAGGLKFDEFGTPTAGSDCLAFYGANGSHFGVYYHRFYNDYVDAAMCAVCDQKTHLPTIGKPTSISEHVVIDGDGVYFVASNGVMQGIFVFNTVGGWIEEVYVCPFAERLSEISVDHGHVVFEKQECLKESDNGIWYIKPGGLAEKLVTPGLDALVQIKGNPMNANYSLHQTGKPSIGNGEIVFVGTLANCLTGRLEQALIRTNGAGNLFSIIKSGDELKEDYHLIEKPFTSSVAFQDGLIVLTVACRSASRLLESQKVLAINSNNVIHELAVNTDIGPNDELFTDTFARSPMTSSGKILFLSRVLLDLGYPSLNLFGYSMGGFNGLETLIEGFVYPYQGKRFLQCIDHNSAGYCSNLFVARCYWNDGQMDREDCYGIYAYIL